VRTNEKSIARVGGPVWKSRHGLAAFTRAVDLLGALALRQGANSAGYMIRLLRSESAGVTCRERIESSLLPRSQIGQPMPLTTAGSRQAKPNQAVRRADSESEILERPGTLAEAAYERVAASLMEGGYVPGDRLAVRTLAAQLGVSLTPAREAVLRLVSEGALELRNPRTIVVPTLSSRQFREIYCIRHALEPTATRLASAPRCCSTATWYSLATPQS
jgi:hypothetical protein